MKEHEHQSFRFDYEGTYDTNSEAFSFGTDIQSASLACLRTCSRFRAGGLAIRTPRSERCHGREERERRVAIHDARGSAHTLCELWQRERSAGLDSWVDDELG